MKTKRILSALLGLVMVLALLPTTAFAATDLTVPPANPVDVIYDTFDYRAYANIYPDVKAAYGYDAQKLWAHYVNYGKAEGRVAFAISVSDNPKSGATTYKNAADGTGYTSYDGPATISATYLDPLPPSSNHQAQNWHDYQLTRPQFMSNAKLVAEWHSIMDVINNQKTGFNYDIVRMTRRSALVGELSHRALDFEKIYCYENGIKTIASTTVSDKDYQETKTSEEYGRAAQSDCIILLHWMYGWRESSLTKQIFPTPPANPGTAGQTSTTTPTAPAGPAVSLTKQNLTVNGAAKNTEIYNIDGSNYFKLRDMAALLNGTGSQFSVDYDAAESTIVVKTGAAYTLAGGELATGTDKSSTATASKQSIEIDGKKADLTAYNIGGNNFFKLRDLGTALGFDVDYDSATSTMIVKSK